LAASDIGNSVSQSKQIVNEMFFKNSGFQKICDIADCFRRFALHFGPYACPKEQSTIFTNGRGLNFNHNQASGQGARPQAAGRPHGNQGAALRRERLPQRQLRRRSRVGKPANQTGEGSQQGETPWEGANQHQPKVDPKGETERLPARRAIQLGEERTSQIFTKRQGLNFNHGLIGLTRMAEGEVFALRMGRAIKASASALAGDFDFPPLTLWRARALPLCFDGHFIRVYSC
jgi:hypothetical protein